MFIFNFIKNLIGVLLDNHWLKLLLHGVKMTIVRPECYTKMLQLRSVKFVMISEWLVKSLIIDASYILEIYCPVTLYAYLGMIRRHLADENIESDMSYERRISFLTNIKSCQESLSNTLKNTRDPRQ